MMNFFNLINTRKRRAEKERQEEMAFNYKMAELNREAASIKKGAEKLKAEAILFEQKGEHDRAIAAAAAAVNQERSYNAAVKTIQTCKNMHIQAKSQKSLNRLIQNCTELVHRVSGEVNVADIIAVQNEFENTKEVLAQSEAALAAVQEGFTVDTDVKVRNEAGEAALAQIMREAAPQEALPAAPAVVPAETAETSRQLAEHAEWVSDRRKVLAEMV